MFKSVTYVVKNGSGTGAASLPERPAIVESHPFTSVAVKAIFIPSVGLIAQDNDRGPVTKAPCLQVPLYRKFHTLQGG